MARSRKPLIEPGSVLPPSDTLSRILERDRTRSGRRAPSDVLEADSPDTQPNGQSYAHITSHMPAQTASGEDAQRTSQPDGRLTSQEAIRAGADVGLLQDAHITGRQALQMRDHESFQARTQTEVHPGGQLTAHPGEQQSVQPSAPEHGQSQTQEYAIRETSAEQIHQPTVTNGTPSTFTPTAGAATSAVPANSGRTPGADSLQRASQLAATRLIPITLRIPEGLNDWLDDYAHEHRKEGVKKQDLISRAVQLLVIEAEGGPE